MSSQVSPKSGFPVIASSSPTRFVSWSLWSKPRVKAVRVSPRRYESTPAWRCPRQRSRLSPSWTPPRDAGGQRVGGHERGGGVGARLQEGVDGSEVPEPTAQTGTAARAVDVGVAQVVAVPVLDEVVLEPGPEAPRVGLKTSSRGAAETTSMSVSRWRSTLPSFG